MRQAVQVKKCPRCGFSIPSSSQKCIHCGIYVFSTLSHRKSEVGGLDPDGTILLSNVKSAIVDRVETHLCGAIFGTSVLDDGRKYNGVIRTSANLIGGNRGAGKSTLATQIVSEISLLEDRETLYVACEEANAEVKLRGDRLKIPNMNQIRIVNALTGASNVADVVAKRKPAAVVIDSLRGLVGDDAAASGEACKLSKRLAVEFHCPFFLIQHVTKDEEIVGSNDDQHEVDCVMKFFPTRAEGESDIRILTVEKNRFGRAFIEQCFQMTEIGLVMVGSVKMPDDND